MNNTSKDKLVRYAIKNEPEGLSAVYNEGLRRGLIYLQATKSHKTVGDIDMEKIYEENKL